MIIHIVTNVSNSSLLMAGVWGPSRVCDEQRELSRNSGDFAWKWNQLVSMSHPVWWAKRIFSEFRWFCLKMKSICLHIASCKSSLLAFANFSSLHCWKIVTHRKGTIWSMTWAEGKPQIENGVQNTPPRSMPCPFPFAFMCFMDWPLANVHNELLSRW